MKTYLFLICLLLSACSQTNSMQPFDDEQAANLASRMIADKECRRSTS